MGNSGSTSNGHRHLKRDESFGSPSPRVRHSVNNGDVSLIGLKFLKIFHFYKLLLNYVKILDKFLETENAASFNMKPN